MTIEDRKELMRNELFKKFLVELANNGRYLRSMWNTSFEDVERRAFENGRREAITKIVTDFVVSCPAGAEWLKEYADNLRERKEDNK